MGSWAPPPFHSLLQHSIRRGGPPDRQTNRPTWQVPGCQAAQSAPVHSCCIVQRTEKVCVVGLWRRVPRRWSWCRSRTWKFLAAACNSSTNSALASLAKSGQVYYTRIHFRHVPDIRLRFRFWPKRYQVPDISINRIVIGLFWQLVHPQNRLSSTTNPW